MADNDKDLMAAILMRGFGKPVIGGALSEATGQALAQRPAPQYGTFDNATGLPAAPPPPPTFGDQLYKYLGLYKYDPRVWGHAFDFFKEKWRNRNPELSPELKAQIEQFRLPGGVGREPY